MVQCCRRTFGKNIGLNEKNKGKNAPPEHKVLKDIRDYKEKNRMITYAFLLPTQFIGQVSR